MVSRKAQKYVSTLVDENDHGDLRKIDALLLTHQFDTDALYITHPLIFKSENRYSEYKNILLDKIQKKIEELAKIDPVDMLLMDQTNRYPLGKIIVHVHMITNFNYMNNIFVKLTLGPWQLSTRRIMMEKLDFNQTFYIPAPNNFSTLKIEVLNLQSDGWFKEHFKENLIASYEIRLPDINKEPFDQYGNIALPIPVVKKPKELGLIPIEIKPEEEKK